MNVSKSKRDCEKLPPWYYGNAYRKWECDVTVYHIIPLNYVIRFAMFIKCKWDKFRIKPSYIDRQIIKLERERSNMWREHWQSHFLKKLSDIEEQLRRKYNGL